MKNERQAKRLRAAREAAGMSQTQAAKKLGCTPNHLARVERFEKGVSIELIEKAAAVYGVSVAWLLVLPGAPKPHGMNGNGGHK